MRQLSLLRSATPFLLQSATWFITNCDRYYKVRWIYYKLRQVLQSAMIITNCDSTHPLDPPHRSAPHHTDKKAIVSRGCGNRVWKGIFGIRDLTKIRCGNRENDKYIDGIRDLTVPREAGLAKNWVRDAGFMFACLSGMPETVTTHRF